MNDVLELRGVCVAFGKRRVLDGLDLRLEPGKVTVLLGCNGTGKSTLLRLLLGVLRPRAGSVRVFGRDPLRAHREVLQRVGYVPDVPDVYPWMTPRQLLAFLQPHYRRSAVEPGPSRCKAGAMAGNFCRPTIAAFELERAHALAARLDVPLDVRFGRLSRGQGMKAMFAAALAPDPELLLLDEPFAGLDPLVREEVLQGLIGELRDGERTVLCATHQLDIAARIADRVAVLHGGKVVRHGELDEVIGTGSEGGQAGNLPTRLHHVLAELHGRVPEEVSV
ncbi:MAG: ABC transporter ATP-binding protein [Planctomycetota bacterium]